MLSLGNVDEDSATVNLSDWLGINSVPCGEDELLQLLGKDFHDQLRDRLRKIRAIKAKDSHDERVREDRRIAKSERVQ